MKTSHRIITFFTALFWQNWALGASLGEASQNLLGPLSGLNNLIYLACRIFGIALIMSAVVQYTKYRHNPSEVRLSTPVILLILGLVVFFVPWLVQISQGAGVLTGRDA